MLYFFAGFVALVVAMSLIPALMKAAGRFSLLDQPGTRKIHGQAMPRIGGIAIAVGAMLPVLLWVPITREYAALLGGMALILLFGLWDDWKDLDYRLKFVGQMLAVLIVVVYGGVVIDHIPFMDATDLPPVIAVPFTVFALIGITNAINLADGLDGLAGGTSLLSLAGIALLAYLVDGTPLVLVSLAIGGAILGFLRYNTHPARIFMGDSGSQFLGFSLGVMVVILTQNVHTALSPVVALLLLGVPILDTVLVMSQRVYQGRSPFSPDNNHIHHRLMKLGFDHYEAVFLIYVAQTFLVLAAYLLRYDSDIVLLAIYGIFCLGTLGCLYYAHRVGWHIAGGIVQRQSFIARQVVRLRANHLLSRGPFHVIKISLSLAFLVASLVISHVPRDIGMMSLLLFAALLATLSVQRAPFNLLERLVIYVTGAFVVYLLQTAASPQPFYTAGFNVYFVALAIAVIVGVRFTWSQEFRVTTLDFLVLFIALVVPHLPDFALYGSQMAAGVTKVIVVFYAIEFVTRSAPRYWDLLRFGTLASLAVLGVRGLLLGA